MENKLTTFPCFYYLNNRLSRREQAKFFAIIASMFGKTPEEAADSSDVFARGTKKLFNGTMFTKDELLECGKKYFDKPYGSCAEIQKRTTSKTLKLKENCCVLCRYSHNFSNYAIDKERHVLRSFADNHEAIFNARCTEEDFHSFLSLSCTDDISEYPVVPFHSILFENLRRNGKIDKPQLTSAVMDNLRKRGIPNADSMISMVEKFINLQVDIIQRLQPSVHPSILVDALLRENTTSYSPPEHAHIAKTSSARLIKKSTTDTIIDNNVSTLCKASDNIFQGSGSPAPSSETPPADGTESAGAENGTPTDAGSSGQNTEEKSGTPMQNEKNASDGNPPEEPGYPDKPPRLSDEFIKYIMVCGDHAECLKNTIAFIEDFIASEDISVETAVLSGTEVLLFYIRGSYYLVHPNPDYRFLRRLLSDTGDKNILSVCPVWVHATLNKMNLHNIRIESLAVHHSLSENLPQLVPLKRLFRVNDSLDLYRSIMPQYSDLYHGSLQDLDDDKRYRELLRLEWCLGKTYDTSFLFIERKHAFEGGNAMYFHFLPADCGQICRKGGLFIVTLKEKKDLSETEALCLWQDVAGRIASSSHPFLQHFFLLGLGNGISIFTLNEEEFFYDSLMASARSAYKNRFKKELNANMIYEKYETSLCSEPNIDF